MVNDLLRKRYRHNQNRDVVYISSFVFVTPANTSAASRPSRGGESSLLYGVQYRDDDGGIHIAL